MRNFTLLLAAATLSVSSAFAAIPVSSINDVVVRGNKVAKNVTVDFKDTYQDRESRAYTGNPITNPLADDVSYKRISSVYLNQYGLYTDESSMGTIAWGADDKVYLKNYIALLQCGDVYIKGTATEDQITIQLPQYGLKSGSMKLWVSLCNKETFEEDGENYIKYVPVADEDNVIIYNKDEEGAWVLDLNADWDGQGWPDQIVSLYDMNDEENGWYPYFVIQDKFIPFTEEAIILPETAEKADYYMMTTNALDHGVTFAVDGDDVYMGTLDKVYLNEGWAKGVKNGDKITFENPQYLGQFSVMDYPAYWMVAVIDEEAESVSIPTTVTFTIEDGNVVAPDGVSLFLNAASDKVYYIDEFDEPTFLPCNPDAVAAAPINPQFLAGVEYDEKNGYGAMVWYMPSLSTQLGLLDTENMYYNLYTDGDAFILSPDDYADLSTELKDVPYGLNLYDANDDYVLEADFALHYLYFYFEVLETVGCQLFYVDGGQVYSSELVTYNFKTGEKIEGNGIVGVAADKAVVSVEYYNLAGARVSNPNGFCIMKAIFSDGTSKSVKVSVRK